MLVEEPLTVVSVVYVVKVGGVPVPVGPVPVPVPVGPYLVNVSIMPIASFSPWFACLSSVSWVASDQATNSPRVVGKVVKLGSHT